MTLNHSIELLTYGLLVAGLNLVAHRIAPDFAGVALITGGLLIMLLGVLGLCGLRRRFWPVVTLIIIAILLLVQAWTAWFAVKSGVDELKPVAVIHSLLLSFAIVQLMNLGQRERDLHVKRGKSGGSGTKDDGAKNEDQKHMPPVIGEGR